MKSHGTIPVTTKTGYGKPAGGLTLSHNAEEEGEDEGEDERLEDAPS